MIGLEVIFQTISLNGDVLVAFGNTSLITETRARNAASRMLRGKKRRAVHDAEDGQSVQRASKFSEDILQEPKPPREAANSRH